MAIIIINIVIVVLLIVYSNSLKEITVRPVDEKMSMWFILND